METTILKMKAIFCSFHYTRNLFDIWRKFRREGNWKVVREKYLESRIQNLKKNSYSAKLVLNSNKQWYDIFQSEENIIIYASKILYL